MGMNNQPIRIAQVIGKWLGGGVESVVMNYYRHIDRSKIQFDFICDADSTNIPYDEIEKLGGRVILVPPYQKVFKYQKELKRIFKENKYKIVHSHINTLSVFPLYAAKCSKVPVRIAHSHSTTNKKEWKKNLLKQALRPFSKVYATNYMCCSELAGRWLFGNKEYDKGNVYLLNNAIDLDKFKYDEKIRKQKRKELNINDSTLVIGHIGRFVAQKNHTFLIDIFNEVHKQNQDSLLMLVGQGPLMNEIQEKVNNLGLKDSVIFLGQRNDANELYQAMDVFVLPSLYEGLPVVGVEAQASGLLCFLSSDMTKETKVLDSTKFMSLSNSAEEWSNEILKSFKSYKKHDTNKEVSKYGFDISEETSKLEKYYIKRNTPTIIHVINSKIFSGLESVACDIITSDLKNNFNFIYVTQNGPIVDALKERYINYEIIRKMSIHEIKRVIKKYNPSVIQAHDFTASCICATIKGKIPLIEHLHNNCPWLKKLGLNSILFLFAGLRANKILTVSASIEKEYIFSNFIKDKIMCIGNPVSRNKVLSKVDNDDYNKKYDICCVARLTKQKNPQRFISIIESLKTSIPNVHAVWVGTGELENECKKTVKEKSLEDWEGYGLVAFEALTLGLPCVVSNVGGLSNIVDKESSYLCNDKKEYVDASLKLLKFDNYKFNVMLAQKQSEKIENIKEYINIISNIYTSVLEEK